MNVQLIADFIQELFINQYTRGAIIGLTIYIWIVQAIGHFVVKGIKSLFKKKGAKSKDTQQEEQPTTNESFTPSFKGESPPVGTELNERYLDLR